VRTRVREREDGLQKRIVVAKVRGAGGGRHRLVERATDHVALLVDDGQGLLERLGVGADLGPGARWIREHDQAYEPVQNRFGIPRAERRAAKRIGVHRISNACRWKLRRLEMPCLRLAASERRAHDLRHSQHLSRRQSRRGNGRVPVASMSSRPLEFDERQDRRQRLHAVLRDIARFRVGAVG
jgi:hypothetical protein